MPRVKVTPEDHVQHYNDLIAFIQTAIDDKCKKKEPGVKVIRKILKQVTSLRKELPSISRAKAFKNRKSSISDTQYVLSNGLCDFFQVDRGTIMSRSQVLKGIAAYAKYKPKNPEWEYINPDGRDLQNPTDRKTILPDVQLAKLFGVKKGAPIPYIGIQKYISQHLNKVEEDEVEDTD